jgi:hypothetical protein
MKLRVTLALVVLFSLTACGNNDVRSTLGLKKSAPDEFRVISNPPLSLPPEFQTNSSGGQQGRSFIEQFENKQSPAPYMYAEDNAFLNRFGGKEQNTRVKSQIENEYNQEKIQKENKGVIRKALSKLNQGGDPTVNPVAEKKRISENIASGKNINDGDVKMREKSTLDRILN